MHLFSRFNIIGLIMSSTGRYIPVHLVGSDEYVASNDIGAIIAVILVTPVITTHYVVYMCSKCGPK